MRGRERPTAVALTGYALAVLLGSLVLAGAIDDLDAMLESRRGPLAVAISPILILVGTVRFVVLWRRRRSD